MSIFPLYLEMQMALKPSRSASCILVSTRETALISPESPTSPAKQIWRCNAWSSKDEINDATTERSIAGSLILIPLQDL